MFCLSSLKECKKEYKQLIQKKHELLDKDNDQSKPGDEFDLLDRQINEFVEGKYAEEVFRYYSKKRPKLIRLQTGEEISWEDAFGETFESITKSSRHSLVGLVEGGGKYKIK